MRRAPDLALTDSDAIVWTVERDPALRSTITGLVALDGVPDVERLRARLERVSRLVPRLRQRIVPTTPDGGSPVWVTDADLDIDYHFRHVRLPAPGSRAQALELAETMAMAAFDPARPLWEAVLAEGLHDGGAALVIKIHHAITDGLGAFQIAAHLVDSGDGDDETPLPAAPEPTQSGALGLVFEQFAERLRIASRRTADTMAGVGRRVVDVAGDPAKVLDLLGTVPSVARLLAPAGSRRSPLFAEASSRSWRLEMLDAPKGELKRAAKSAGGTINDAFLAIISGGLRRYHDAFGVPCDEVRVSMPVNLRVDDDAMAGNRFTPVRFDLPLGPDDPVARMRALGALARERRKDPALALTDTLAGVLRTLPPPVLTQVFGSMLKGVDVVASNVPGSPVPMSIAGAGVRSIHAFAPPAGAALSVTLITHVDRCCFGVQADPAAVTDLPLFLGCLQDAIDEVLALAGPPARTGASKATGAKKVTAKATGAKKGTAKATTAKATRAKKGSGPPGAATAGQVAVPSPSAEQQPGSL
jgi:diacylglycerol O-acyltransferase